MLNLKRAISISLLLVAVMASVIALTAAHPPALISAPTNVTITYAGRVGSDETWAVFRQGDNRMMKYAVADRTSLTFEGSYNDTYKVVVITLREAERLNRVQWCMESGTNLTPFQTGQVVYAGETALRMWSLDKPYSATIIATCDELLLLDGWNGLDIYGYSWFTSTTTFMDWCMGNPEFGTSKSCYFTIARQDYLTPVLEAIWLNQQGQ